jgi:competence protein ComEA
MHLTSPVRPRPVLTIAAMLLAGAILSACGGDPPRPRVVPETAAAGAAAASGDGAQPSIGGGLVVDVAGAVRDPGVYRMPAGARVHEAIEAAGGLAADAEPGALNRAAPVVDGQQVLVPVAGSAAVAPDGGAGARVSINAADVTQLQQLPGIGPVTAAKIVAERDSGGPYASIDDLQRVPGVGPATIESVRDAATT